MKTASVAALTLALASVTAAAQSSFAGIASFYGNESGSRTASGERFNENLLTCAHPSLPFGTRLYVSYHGRGVICCVNDRGPYKKRRVLDLSTASALAIGLSHRVGIGHVTAEIVPGYVGSSCREH